MTTPVMGDWWWRWDLVNSIGAVLKLSAILIQTIGKQWLVTAPNGTDLSMRVLQSWMSIASPMLKENDKIGKIASIQHLSPLPAVPVQTVAGYVQPNLASSVTCEHIQHYYYYYREHNYCTFSLSYRYSGSLRWPQWTANYYYYQLYCITNWIVFEFECMVCTCDCVHESVFHSLQYMAAASLMM